MFECEKCLHEEICDQASRQLWGTMQGEKECSDFIHRTNCVEVVRCKDCMKRPTCEHTRALGINGFCSDGEKA